jgi:hypothetical protein
MTVHDVVSTFSTKMHNVKYGLLSYILSDEVNAYGGSPILPSADSAPKPLNGF